MSNELKIFLIVSVIAAVGVTGYAIYAHYYNDGSTPEAKWNRKIVHYR